MQITWTHVKIMLQPEIRFATGTKSGNIAIAYRSLTLLPLTGRLLWKRRKNLTLYKPKGDTNMKKWIAILIVLTMLLSLAACGGETAEDPNAGKYLGTTAKALGMTMDMSEIYPGETWLELKSGGKGTIMLDGDDFPITWALEGDAFTLTIDGVDSVGTLADGVITIDLMDMGVEMNFLKEGMEMPVVEATFNDAGYWEVVRIESEDPESVISEEDMVLVKEAGVLMYLELKEDGTGVMYLDEEMPVTWQDGTIVFTEDALSVSYTVENGELVLDMVDMTFVLRRGEA